MLRETLEVRRATFEDLEALLPLVRAYRTFYGQAADDDGVRRFLSNHLRDGSSVVFLAERSEGAIAFVQIFESWSTVHLAPQLILEDLFVEDAQRGKGVARALLCAAAAYARDVGAAAMFLETATENRRAQAVYEREGWSREARFVKYNAPL